MTARNVDWPRAGAALPVANWFSHLPELSSGPDPQEPVVEARLGVMAAVEVHASVGGGPVAELPVEVVPGMRTWLPVVGGQPGWVRVLLPCAPQGSSGWIRLCPEVLILTHLVHVVVDTRARTLTLHHGRSERTWECQFTEEWVGPFSVGWPCRVGKAASPTPRGRTFVVGEVHPTTGIVDRALVLEAHMSTHLAHGAGIDAVGNHSWPSASWGHAGSDGSLVVPPTAMPVLAEVARPGTVVLIR